MTEQQLKDKIKSLAERRKSDEIVFYLTGDKKPPQLFATTIASDVLPIFDKHLSKLGRKNKLSLFLYSTGGSLEAPWPLVSLIREYCKEFEVIVPAKALSAATLICLGADKVVMNPSSFLSPIDPLGSYRLGKERKNIQIEDVTGFIDFAKTKVGVSEQNSLSEVMKLLSAEIPPSVLGSINRTHSLIRSLAEKMLRLHKIKIDENQVKQIIENLTEKLYSHRHLIGRNEAKTAVGFKNIICYTTPDEEKEIKEIFGYFVNSMQLDKAFNPSELVSGTSLETNFELKRAIIKSSKGEDAYMTDYKIQKIQEPTAPKPFNISFVDRGWNEISVGEERTSSRTRRRR